MCFAREDTVGRNVSRTGPRRSSPTWSPPPLWPPTPSVHDETSAEDPEACYAGAPFVQPEHEEEWMGFVNWAEVEAQAGGSSSS